MKIFSAMLSLVVVLTICLPLSIYSQTPLSTYSHSNIPTDFKFKDVNNSVVITNPETSKVCTPGTCSGEWGQNYETSAIDFVDPGLEKGNAKMVQTNSLEEASSCKPLEQSCETPVIYPQPKEFYDLVEGFQPLLKEESYNSEKNESQNKRLGQVHCDCLISQANSLVADTRPIQQTSYEKEVFNEAQLKVAGEQFINELAKFREDFGLYIYTSNGLKAELTKRNKIDKSLYQLKPEYSSSRVSKAALCDDPEIFLKEASSCNKGPRFEKDLRIYLNPRNNLKENSFTNMWNDLMNDMDIIKSKDGAIYKISTHQMGRKSAQKTQLSSVIVDQVMSIIFQDSEMLATLSKEFITNKGKDTDPKMSLFIFLNDSKNREKIISKLSPVGNLTQSEISKIKNNKLNLNYLIEKGINDQPFIENLLYDQNFAKEAGIKYKQFLKRLNEGDKSYFSDFLDANPKFLSSQFEMRCEQLITKFKKGICKDEAFLKENVSGPEILSSLEKDKFVVNGMLVDGLGEGFDLMYCKENKTPKVIVKSDYYKRLNPSKNARSGFLAQAEGHFKDPEKHNSTIASMIDASGIQTDGDILSNIFGDSYTKYFPKSTYAGVQNSSESSSGSKFDFPTNETPSVIAPQIYPTSASAFEDSNNDKGQEIEESSTVQAAAARKELEDFFKNSKDPEVKNHLANMSDEQVIKLQEELQRVREKNASDMASLRSQIDALTQKKEFEAKYDKLQKEYDALKDQNERISKPVMGNSPYSSSSSNSNSYTTQRPQVGSGSSSSFSNSSSSSGRSTANISNSQSAGSIGVGGQVSSATAGVESRKVNLTFESKNPKDEKKTGLMVLEVSEVVTGNPVEMASRDLDKYLTQNESKLDSEKLSLITDKGVLYRFKGPNNQLVERQIPYSNIDQSVKNRIQYMMKTKKIEREMKEVSYAYLVNIIDQYGKK